MPILIPKSALDKLAADYRKREGILDEIPAGGFTINEFASALKLKSTQAGKVILEHGDYVGKFRQGSHWIKVYTPKKKAKKQ